MSIIRAVQMGGWKTGSRWRGFLRLAAACVSALVLAITEWRLWTAAEKVQVADDAKGTGLLAGLGLLLAAQLLALLVFGLATRSWTLVPPNVVRRPTHLELWLVLGITVIGLILRLGALQEFPVGLWFDTAENGNQALRILREPNYRPVFVADATQLPALFLYLDALAIHWLGPEALAVRVPSALFGAATVPALWWLGRMLGGPALGVAAAFALATSRWHIDFSRLAIASTVSPFALAVALAATLAGLRAERRWQQMTFAALAGLAVSLGLWTYPASALMVPAVVAGVAWWVVRGGRVGLLGRARKGAGVLIVAGAVSAITLAPLLVVLIKQPELVLQRSATVSALGGQNSAGEVAQSAIQHVLMYTVKGDRNGRHNMPGRPELGWFAPFFLAGVGGALWRWRRGSGLALPGALVFLAGGIFSLPFEAPQSHRSILALVPASLLVALPIALFWSRARWLAAILGVSLVVAGGVESADYFRAQVYEPAVYLENSLPETAAARWLKSLPPNVPVLASERFRTYPSVRFLSGDHPSVAQGASALSEFLPLDGSRPVAIVSSQDERALFDRARSLYPTAPLQTLEMPLDRRGPLLYTLFVPKLQQDQAKGFLAEDASGSITGVPSVQGADAVAWSATMRLLRTATYTVDGGGADVTVDGRPVVGPAQPSATVFLARGAHALRIRRAAGGPIPQFRVVPTSPSPPLRPGTPAATAPEVQFYALPAPGGLLFSWQIEGTPGTQALVDSAPHRGFDGSFFNGHPWTAQWRGRLRIDTPGAYAFHMDAISTASVTIDDTVLLATTQVGAGAEKELTLTAGWHTLRVDYVDRDPYARLFFRWRPPGEPGFSEIPDGALQPALDLP